MKKVSVLAACSLLGVSLLSGCATITSGTTQSVNIVTEKEVHDAKCELTDKKGGKWWVPSTPGSASVRKGDGPLSIVCKKDGYKIAKLIVDETLVPATFGNIILGGGIGILVDAASGAAQQYPDQITVWMEPDGFKSEQEKVAWLKEKEEFELAQKKDQQNDQTVSDGSRQ
ncbi:MAG: hypothetical protein ACOY8P_04015 [Thermodesulfobacteriota bacterium]